MATVNYQQGTLYENIENFSYTSYRPSIDFILSGLEEGEATITATHVKTGITDIVKVNVETPQDQLYLFQCYPKAKTTLNHTVYTAESRTDQARPTSRWSLACSMRRTAQSGRPAMWPRPL